MIDHDKENLEDALGVRDTFKTEIKESLVKYIEEKGGLTDRKTHLIEYIKDDLSIQGEHEMFLLGAYIKEFEMVVEMKDKVQDLLSTHLTPKIKFQSDEFLKYLKEDKDDF